MAHMFSWTVDLLAMAEAPRGCALDAPKRAGFGALDRAWAPPWRQPWRAFPRRWFNGAGKNRLMALFRPGAHQFVIELKIPVGCRFRVEFSRDARPRSLPKR